MSKQDGACALHSLERVVCSILFDKILLNGIITKKKRQFSFLHIVDDGFSRYYLIILNGEICRFRTMVNFLLSY